MGITIRDIEAARTQAARSHKAVMLWDDELRGLGCRVAPSGKASWLVKKRLGLGGRQAKVIKHVFGDLASLKPDKARDAALTLIREIKSGVHLNRRTQETRAQTIKASRETLESAVSDYIKKRSKPGRFWSELEDRFNKHIVPELGNDTPISEITKADIRRLVEAKEETHPAAARTLFEVLRPFFKWCVSRDLILVSPIADLVAPPVPEARERVLTDSEIKTLWFVTQFQFLFGPLHQLLLLTAQRRDEVGAMRWSELDLDKAEWIIPKERTKNGKEHLVHLSPQVMAILRGISRFKDSDLVFTTTGATPVSGYSKAKAQLDKRMGIVTDPDAEGYNQAKLWRVHDLRRTAASGMAALGSQPHIIERVLNHVSGATGGLVSVYQRHEYLPERKRAIEAWGAHVEQLVSGTQQSNVHKLRHA